MSHFTIYIAYHIGREEKKAKTFVHYVSILIVFFSNFEEKKLSYFMAGVKLNKSKHDDKKLKSKNDNKK